MKDANVTLVIYDEPVNTEDLTKVEVVEFDYKRRAFEEQHKDYVKKVILQEFSVDARDVPALISQFHEVAIKKHTFIKSINIEYEVF